VNYRVDELARAAGVGVDTVRFYQSRGLLPPPERRGRIALYSRDHLERLRRIRALNRQGLKLEAVRRVLADDRAGKGRRTRRGSMRVSLLRALEPGEAERSYTREELDRVAGLPPFLVAALEEAGLLCAAGGEGARYGESDRAALESARALLEAGLPFSELLGLAREHVAHVERIAEKAVDLCEAHVREARSHDPARGSAEQIAETFGRLLPAVTRLVAVHFERALIARARARLLAARTPEGEPQASEGGSRATPRTREPEA
jgi:DNA-binding transcriptional MerR regulator